MVKEIIKGLECLEVEEIIENYNCCKGKYTIPIYIPKLNIAIKFSDKEFKYWNMDIEEDEIEEELRCRFIFINSKNSAYFNIGYIIKDILEMGGNQCGFCGCNMTLSNGIYYCGNCGEIKRYEANYSF